MKMAEKEKTAKPKAKATTPRKRTAAAPVEAAPVEVAAGPSGLAEPRELPEHMRNRRTEVGRVVSDKMEKTVVVVVERRKAHPIYKKVMRRSAKFMAHDELGSGEGDTVRIIEARPMSARKRWQVVEIIAKAEKI
jgi:small subunit ribosomal protein S17